MGTKTITNIGIPGPMDFLDLCMFKDKKIFYYKGDLTECVKNNTYSLKPDFRSLYQHH